MERNSKTSDKNSIKTALIYSYKFLNKKERFQLKRNVTLSFFAGIFEIISITTVYPLVSVIVEPNLIENNKYIFKIWSFLGNPPQNKFVIILTLGASAVLVISVFLNFISQLFSTRDSSSAEERLAKEYYEDLIYAPYKWHLSNNPNSLRTIIL